MLAYRPVRRGDDGLAASRLAALVFFAFTPGFAPQMLLWPLAFAPERREASHAGLFSLFRVAGWAELLRLNAVNPLALLLAWVTVLAWAWRLLPRALRAAPSRGMNPHGA